MHARAWLQAQDADRPARRGCIVSVGLAHEKHARMSTHREAPPGIAASAKSGGAMSAAEWGLLFALSLVWGGSFFLVAVIVGPVVESTGWPQGAVVGALSLAILVSGLLSPWVGTRIRRLGGRPVLVAGTLVMAAGLVLMAMAGSLPVFLAAWAVMGVGMAGALYDPLFAAIGQAYGASARGAMTQIAIASGFAITLCWPASSFLVAHIGWRGA